jgi:hypothetical protein
MKNIVKVIDDFLPQETFQPIKELVMSQKFPYFYRASISYDREKDSLNSYLSHFLYKDDDSADCDVARGPWSEYFKQFNPIVTKIKEYDDTFFTLLRMKANLYSRTETVQVHEWHVDYDYSHKGIILYFNNNDGYTELFDGTKIESVENRALFFDPGKDHRSTNCTDQKARFNLNVNYL